ncbi:MAG: M48 family metallopeptidase [Paludibacteraceae bacterium]
MVVDKELGEIHFKQNLRAKRMNVRVQTGRLLVTLPPGFKESDGLRFIESIREKLVHRQAETMKHVILITGNQPFRTLTFNVFVKPTTRKDLFSSMKPGVLTIEYPQELDVTDERTQRYFWNSIDFFLRQEAKIMLPMRTKDLAKKHGFSYSAVKIQSSKTRWGSCSMKRTINLSFYLLLLPSHLIDYVILHELCHTKEMNHSPRFWEWMDKVTDGNAEKLRTELRKYRAGQ